MKYISKNNSNIGKKQKLYLCATEGDIKNYLSDISKEIFEYSDSVVFYRESGDIAALAEEDMNQMQICVVLVTTDFLSKKEVIVFDDFIKFEQSSIPVLPILIEEDLESWFDSVCGNLHCLKRNDYHAYTKDLRTYLEQVLASDEMYEQIRALFKKNIFISYRKKDKEYVVKLIHAIYDDASLTDTAIWYDGYLVPGENFDDAIQDAIDMSDLFVLAVTPSLLENPNYVIAQEYPAAYHKGIEILPVHGMPTDLNQLKELFENIPEGVDYADTVGLHSTIQKLLKAENCESEPSPLATYYLGMAFLKGINVEYRPERGIEYITSAAEDGLLTAMKQLVLIYKNGDGTGIDFEKAVQWQEKVVEREKAEQNGDAEQVESYLQAQLDLIILLGYAGRMVQALEWCGKAIEYYEAVEEKYTGGSFIGGAIEIFKRKMDIELDLGILEEARDTCLKCFSAMQWVSENADEDDIDGMSGVIQRLGYIYRLTGDYANALEFYQLRLAYIEKHVDELGTESVVNAYIDLCDIYVLQGKLDDAEQCLKKAQAIGALDSTSESNFYERLGDIYRDKKKYEVAETYYRQALSISTALYENTKKIKDMRGVAVAYCKLGIISARMNQLENSIYWFEKYKNISREIFEKTDTTDSRRGYATSCVNLAEMWAHKDIKTAIIHLKEAEDMFNRTVESNRTFEEMTCLMRCAESLVNKYMSQKEHEAAYYTLVAATKHVNDYLLKTKDERVLPNLAEYCANISEMSKEPDTMFLYLKQATALYGVLANQTQSETYRIRYGSGLLKLGIYAEQADMIEQAREIFVELKKGNPLNQDMDRWIKACDEAIKRWCGTDM